MALVCSNLHSLVVMLESLCRITMLDRNPTLPRHSDDPAVAKKSPRSRGCITCASHSACDITSSMQRHPVQSKRDPRPLQGSGTHRSMDMPHTLKSLTAESHRNGEVLARIDASVVVQLHHVSACVLRAQGPVTCVSDQLCGSLFDEQLLHSSTILKCLL